MSFQKVLIVNFLATTIAASDPLLNTRTCFLSPNSFLAGSINASDSAVINPPFNSSEASQLNLTSKWTWNLAVETHSQSSVSTGLWLETSPPQNLAAPDLKFLACGLVLQGLRTASEESGQHDDGTCTSVISQECNAAIDKAVRSKYDPLQIPTAEGADGAWDICNAWQNLADDGGPGLPDVCQGNFTKDNSVGAFSKSSWYDSFRIIWLTRLKQLRHLNLATRTAGGIAKLAMQLTHCSFSTVKVTIQAT